MAKMKPLTKKQAAYVTAILAGVKGAKAVISAGYSASGASVQAAALQKLPHVRAAIAAGRRGNTVALAQLAKAAEGTKSKRGDADDGDEPRAVLPQAFANSLDFMRATMNDFKQVPFGLRFEAAKQLLPYENARVAEKGKKESKRERAADIAGQPGEEKRPRFGTKKPPALSIVK